MTFQLLSSVGTTKFFMQKLRWTNNGFQIYSICKVLFYFNNKKKILFSFWYFNLNFNPTQQIMNVSGATVCNSTKFHRTGATFTSRNVFLLHFLLLLRSKLCDSAGSFECHSCLNVASQHRQLFCTFANNLYFIHFRARGKICLSKLNFSLS